MAFPHSPPSASYRLLSLPLLGPLPPSSLVFPPFHSHSLCSFAASEPSPGLILKAIAISRRRKKGIKGEGGEGGRQGGEEKEPPLSYSIDPT